MDDAGQALRGASEHFDVLILGAGVSGIGSAVHLQRDCPGRSFVILDALDHYGGTWWTHQYPGVRSDSDLYTFGYRFKAWTGAPIATAERILNYVGEVIEDHDLEQHIRYRHRILAARWSSQAAMWTVEAERTDTGERLTFTAGFLWMCQGYYRHDSGYTPQWPGLGEFEGQVVHPQTWPKDLDYAGKKVVVIGSGATAATLVPSIADDTAHVTMLQRTPTYFVPGRNVDELADELRGLEVDEQWIHEIVRRKRLKMGGEFQRRAREEPEVVKQELLAGVSAFVGPELAAEHFTPSYRPWRQRIAFVPDGDIFKKIKDGKASVVTDEIEQFTPGGIKLKSGRELEADIVVTATGFDLSVLGEVALEIDGVPLNLADTVNYRGMMFTGVPNLVWVFGYFRSSWTLRVDLIGDFVCRLLNHMAAKGVQVVAPKLRPQDESLERLPWMDPEEFNPGYITRGLDRMPRRLDDPLWALSQDYLREKDELPKIDLDGPEFAYSKVSAPAEREPA